MLSIWVAFPSCNPERASQVRDAWHIRGYSVAIASENEDCLRYVEHGILEKEYQGYWKTSNRLCKELVERGADIVVVGADDIYSDLRLSAQDIGEQFTKRFPDFFGVMQPTGDDLQGTDKICGSPWIGKEFINQAYGGKGPYLDEFFQFYGDELMFEETKLACLLWQNPEIVQRHEHWTRKGGPNKLGYQERNSNRWWNHDREIFMKLKESGFRKIVDG